VGACGRNGPLGGVQREVQKQLQADDKQQWQQVGVCRLPQPPTALRASHWVLTRGYGVWIAASRMGAAEGSGQQEHQGLRQQRRRE
jgi:hypothetical protein